LTWGVGVVCVIVYLGWEEWDLGGELHYSTKQLLSSSYLINRPDVVPCSTYGTYRSTPSPWHDHVCISLLYADAQQDVARKLGKPDVCTFSPTSASSFIRFGRRDLGCSIFLFAGLWKVVTNYF
jgi:hypothetical protein